MKRRLEKYLEANRELWNEWTPIHAKSEMYDVARFKQGRSSLKAIELQELGDVKGKSLLHLQCHFGLDTLSWARLGAEVTGVDFSEKAIELARQLSAELQIPAKFICADVWDLHPAQRDGLQCVSTMKDRQFNVVFTSYGVLCWLPDLKPWGEVIAHSLKPGGIFYIVEIHPVLTMFDNSAGGTGLRVTAPYFHSAEPTRWEPEGTYADPAAKTTQPSYEWTHSMSDVLNALIAAGLRIESVHEFPYCVYRHFPFMERGADGWWRLPASTPAMPLMFSLKATRM
ncbi:MAG: class I SAM-dependent methyltransferase [bacterium]